MSESESSSDSSDQESAVMPETGGEMAVDQFEMLRFSMTGFNLEIGGTVCRGFVIGWVTSLRILLYYGNILVAKGARETLMRPDPDNHVSIDCIDNLDAKMLIKSMVGLKSFFEDIMPKASANYELDGRKRATAALKVSSSGLQLTMSMDLANMSRMKPIVKSLKLTGNRLEMTLVIQNRGPFTLSFDGPCDFVLMQGQKYIGNLGMRDLEIRPGETEHVLRGIMQEEVSGMAILRGDNFDDSDSNESWLYYAFELIEFDVNLDEMVVNGKSKTKGK